MSAFVWNSKATAYMCNSALLYMQSLRVSTYTAEGRALEVGAVGGNNQSEVSPEYLLRAQFHVTGLSCASCVNKVERHLKKKNGIYAYVHRIIHFPSVVLVLVCTLQVICLLCYRLILAVACSALAPLITY